MGKAVHRWPLQLHSRICLQTLRAPLPSCRLLSVLLPACKAPRQGVRTQSMPRRGASEGSRGKPPDPELCSSSPSSRERFHCVILARPSGRAQSLRHLCVGLGLGRHRTSLGRPQPLRSLLQPGAPAKCPAGGLLCPQGLLDPVSVPSRGMGGRAAAAAPHEHRCCRAEGDVGSDSVEAVSGGFWELALLT